MSEPQPTERRGNGVDPQIADTITIDDETARTAAADREPTGFRGQRLGRFLVIGPLGQGGMGVVLEAHDETLGRTVALKLLHPETAERHRARLLREAQALARLSHPNVVQIYDIGTIEGQTFIAMELVRGQTLWKWNQPRRSWREIVATYLQAGEGLAAAHHEGLVHRDFKPDNCIIGDEGRVRVLDFGLARGATIEEVIEPLRAAQSDHAAEPPSEREADSEAADRTGLVDTQQASRGERPAPSSDALHAKITRQGALLGTIAYMAHEQLIGRPADARSDQYSFCTSLYEALYGVRPFPGETPAELFASIVGNRMEQVPDGVWIPGGLRRALLRGLERDPQRRWPHMDDLLEELRRILRRRRQWNAIAILTVGAALGGTVAIPLWGGRADPCADPQAGLEGIWDDDARQAVRQAFADHGPADAPELSGNLERRVDDYVQGWVAMTEQSCRATFVTHQQSEALFDRRARCLERRRNRLASSLEAIHGATSTETLLDRMVLPFKLPGLEPCADLEALAARRTLPADPAMRQQLAEIEARIDRAHTLRESGQLGPALELALQARRDAEALDDPEVIADALECVGRLQAEAGSADEAVVTLERAIVVANQANADAVAARAWISLLYARTMLGELDASLAQSLGARAAVERTGDEILRSWLLNNLGILHAERKDWEQASTSLRRALEIKSRVLGEQHVDVGIAWFNYGHYLRTRRDDEEANEAFSRAREIFEATVSHAHPFTAYTLVAQCGTPSALRRGEAALGVCDEAIALLDRSAALPNWQARARFAKARVLREIGQPAAARALAEDARRRVESSDDALSQQIETWLSDTGVMNTPDAEE